MAKQFFTNLNGSKGYSKQIGDSKLLSKLTNKTVIYNFRQNDIKKWRTRSSISSNLPSINFVKN